MPDGLPAASRPMRPPRGSWVAAPIPASRIARELTSAVCPKDDTTMMGRCVFSASSVALVVVTPAGTIPSWNQFTTSSHPSGSRVRVASRHAWIFACISATPSCT